MLEAHGIEKYYGSGAGRSAVLKGIDLTVADGSFTVILGASGSGKSTLLNILSGLERPDGGSVLYDGSDVTRLTEAELTRFRRDTVGFVFQQYYLLPHLTVDKNVRLGADLAGNAAYRDCLAAVGLADKLKSYPAELSGGEQQRVAIARALAKRPRYLFADEPTGALDEQTGRQALDCIDRLQRENGFTVIMVTHNVNIADMADTVVCMNSGRIERIYTNATRKSAYEIGW